MRQHGAQRVWSKTTIGGVLSELSIESTQSSKRIPVYRILVQWAFCIIAVVFGLRVAQEANLVRVNFSRVDEASELFRPSSNRTVHHYEYWIDPKNESTPGLLGAKKSPRVYVGRHPILVRPWPHPDPVEIVHAYKMIARVQLEQQRLYGIQSWKPIIAITPMYVRTFQSVHLTGTDSIYFNRHSLHWFYSFIVDDCNKFKSSHDKPSGLKSSNIACKYVMVEFTRAILKVHLFGPQFWRVFPSVSENRK